jgi:hypothetical protein
MPGMRSIERGVAYFCVGLVTAMIVAAILLAALGGPSLLGGASIAPQICIAILIVALTFGFVGWNKRI